MKKIWTYTKSSVGWVFDFVKGTGSFVIGAFALFIVISALTTPEEKIDVEEGAVLVLRPTGVIVERERLPTPFKDNLDLPGMSSPLPEESIHDLTYALDEAIKDDRIGALAIDTNAFAGASSANLMILVERIQAFKETERPVYAIGTNYGRSGYLLASQADEIFMNPAGFFAPRGYAISRMYYKSMLEKLDASINVFRVGTFKSAVEPYLRDNMSDEARLANEAFITALWDSYDAAVAQGRGLEPGQFKSMIAGLADTLADADGDIPVWAKKRGLVDTLAPHHTMLASLIEKHGKSGKSFKQIGHDDYIAERHAAKPINNAKKKIAVITARGEIIPGSGPINVTAASTVVGYIRKARQDSSTAAIVLRVDSPGGSAYASELIRQELLAAQDQGLPVVASFGSVAASGGYWISATADEIWSEPTTITGSIGIFGVIPTFEKTAAKIGVFSDGLATSEIAAATDLTSALNSSQKRVLQMGIEQGYNQFLTIVSEGRDMPVEDVDKIAQGRVWVGTKAQELGLVDKLGGLDDAIQSAAVLAEIDSFRVAVYRDKLDPLDKFLIDAFGDAYAAKIVGLSAGSTSDTRPMGGSLSQAEIWKTPSPLMAMLQELNNQASQFGSLKDPQGRYILCLKCQAGAAD